ncbi:DNA/RNA polymerase [Cutaneotrichosporon oleaginosum]|uniref:DNA polymerase kappa n=1 Tax=Cutaneotrichosporon oleaginosum TaxID=879819 RepID=A0A0J0XWK2_9TREE|nr:DNA/RNA polymerase [Cutaneotrichosporon oleaginosum]KLT45428.1 DNA/RNA polymerase [Cutaneotrichosporon oleaginosum]
MESPSTAEELSPGEEMTEEEIAALAAAEAAAKRQRSFERSLAGPSVGKAGLTRDQTEINRIIAEASKGSKYYLNQVRKDQELTEKIEWFKAKRDELVRESPMERLESDADRILLEVEALRDLSQTIVHCDLDQFYASVEQQRDPSLKGKAFGVGQGVLTTASYEARKFGCRSGMAGFIAKKLCPHIILTNLHFDLYTAASNKVREVLLQYDENLMMAGLDEGYLNITSYMATHNMTASEVVSKLRVQVEERTGMTISAGIAPNRMLAKICSDKNKPNGQFEIQFDRAAITRFMRDLPIRVTSADNCNIPGFGRVTERCLEGLGVETCGDIYKRRAELLVMNHWFGFRGLCKAYLGIADNNVEPHKRGERKSVGVERTFPDKTANDDILRELESIAEELEKDMATLQYAGKTITVKFKLHTYESKSRALSVKKFTAKKEDILPVAVDLIRKEFPLRIRLLGIRMSNLKDLTVPDTGIRNFLKPGTSSFSRDATQENFNEAFQGGESAGPSPIALDPNPDAGPVCPICSRRLGPETSNADLNEHIDLCLNHDAFAEIAEAMPLPKRVAPVDTRPRKKRKSSGSSSSKVESKTGRGSVLEWLRRG